MELGPILRAMRRNKVRFGLIVMEVALTLAIVANCVAMIRDARAAMTRVSGFDDENLVNVRSTPFEKAFKEDGYLDNALAADLQSLRTMPGVRAASNTRFLPWQGGGSSTEMREAGTRGEMLRTQIYNGDEGTLDTLGVSVSEGRNFTRDEVDRDTMRLRELNRTQREAGPDGLPRDKFLQEVIVTRAYGKLAFGDKPLLGRQLEDSDGDLYRVVGVIDEFYNPYGWPIHEYAVFYPNRARAYEFGSPFLLRTEPGQAAAVAKAVEERLLAVNNGRNLRVQTMDEIKAQYFGPQRLVSTLMSAVTVLLVLVTSLGIVGLTSFSVAERTRQIGTRRALGARRRDVLQHFLAENWLLTTMGVVLGI
ncbi:MAG TPA: FtsX-like permease family protein, partial [Vicinamibacteria bacterium]|nr:FtsX-like permease family protein [Vicinamibacteria bacterium]